MLKFLTNSIWSIDLESWCIILFASESVESGTSLGKTPLMNLITIMITAFFSRHHVHQITEYICVNKEKSATGAPVLLYLGACLSPLSFFLFFAWPEAFKLYTTDPYNFILSKNVTTLKLWKIKHNELRLRTNCSPNKDNSPFRWATKQRF